MKPWEILSSADSEVYKLIERELDRQQDGLEMIASENFASPAVIAAAGNVFTNKYAEGFPGKRYYGGCEVVDDLEALAIERLKSLYGTAFANVQPHSGAQANAAVFLALCKPGDRILGLSLPHGGHLTHGSPVNFSGQYFDPHFYGVDPVTKRLNYESIRKVALEIKPKMIIGGASAYPREIDFGALKAIASEVGAYLMVDMAHIAGLVAAGLHPSPCQVADVVTSTTHKTLRGPRGGIILWNNPEFKFDKAVFPGTQGGPLEHIIAAKAVAFGEASKPAFVDYQKQVLLNAKELAASLMKQGIEIVTEGTDNHIVLVDLSNSELTGKEAERLLGLAGITVNKNTVPYDKRSPFVTSGVRLGTPALTTRGFKVSEMQEVGEMIASILTTGEAAVARVSQKVESLCRKFPLYPQWALR